MQINIRSKGAGRKNELVNELLQRVQILFKRNTKFFIDEIPSRATPTLFFSLYSSEKNPMPARPKTKTPNLNSASAIL